MTQRYPESNPQTYRTQLHTADQQDLTHTDLPNQTNTQLQNSTNDSYRTRLTDLQNLTSPIKLDPQILQKQTTDPSEHSTDLPNLTLQNPTQGIQPTDTPDPNQWAPYRTQTRNLQNLTLQNPVHRLYRT